MKRILTSALLLFILVPAWPRADAQLLPNLGGQRVGISAFQFLKLGADARGVAMGEASVAVANDASSLYWNPAGMVQSDDNQVIASHTEYVADIRHEFLGIVYHVTGQDALGLSCVALHMEDMEVTTETQPFGTGRYFSFGDVAVGLSYARKMTDQFSFGATVRYVNETLDVLAMRAFMFDLGTFYWTGLGSLRFAVVISNFGGDVAPEGSVTQENGTVVSSFQSFSVPTVFKIGIAFEPLHVENHRLTGSFQLNHPNDNSEHVRLGVEYAWNETVFARAGLKRTIRQTVLGDDQTTAESYSAGLGVRGDVGFSRVGADYSYSAFSRLGAVHRFSFTFTF